MSKEHDILVEVKGVSKKFSRSLKQGMLYGLKDMIYAIFGLKGKRSQLRKSEFWAVKDVSFTLRRGECLGLIGHNGAGKSTLLKMLNGLIRPDEGSITMHGKVGALIELGAGFNPLLSGRENIYINGQLLGFTKKEINEKFQDILDFADIGEFIDSPVQNYSSGMKVRLGFAIAAQMEPDILIIDEVLAVGDVGFRIKCYNEIYRLMETTAVLFVSHSMPQIGKICSHGMFMKKGENRLYTSNISEVISAYNNQFKGEQIFIEGNGDAEIRKICFGHPESLIEVIAENEFSQERTIILESDKRVSLSIEFSIVEKIRMYSVLVDVSDSEQKIVSQMSPHGQRFNNDGKPTTINVELDSLMLTLGNYHLNILIHESLPNIGRGQSLIRVRNVLRFSIKEKLFSGAAPVLYNNDKWNVES